MGADLCSMADKNWLLEEAADVPPLPALGLALLPFLVISGYQ